MSVSLKLDDQNKLLVSFPYSLEHIDQIKNIKGKAWHPTEKNWSIPFSTENFQLLKDIFSNERIFYDTKLNSLFNDKNKKDNVQEGTKSAGASKTQQEFDSSSMVKELKLRGYSTKTIRAYIGHITRLSNHFNKHPSELDENDIKGYLLELIEVRGCKFSYIQQALSSIKFYFYNMLNEAAYAAANKLK